MIVSIEAKVLLLKAYDIGGTINKTSFIEVKTNHNDGGDNVSEICTS